MKGLMVANIHKNKQNKKQREIFSLFRDSKKLFLLILDIFKKDLH